MYSRDSKGLLFQTTLYQRLLSRKKFGPDLEFVVLDMELEQQLERVKGRQGDDKETIEMFKVGRNKNVLDIYLRALPG